MSAAVCGATRGGSSEPAGGRLRALQFARSAYGLLRASGRIFLEAAPEGMDPDAIGQALLTEPGVVEVHDLHVWEVTSGFPALSAHVVVKPEADCHQIRFHLAESLKSRFHIDHSTLQVEHEPERLLRLQDAREQ